jgi:hypothetical protein
MRPSLVKSWVLLVYSVPTSVLLLFAALHALDPNVMGLAEDAASVPFGDAEIIALAALLGVLVLLSVGTVIQYWLDARKPEMFVRFLAGASRGSIVLHSLRAVFSVHALGFVAALVGYVMIDFLLPTPQPSVAGVVLAFAVSSVLMVGATSVGVLATTRALDRVEVY